jgi:N-acetylneuraminic acid mutarotase
MLQNYLIYITLWFLFQLIIEINCQKKPYVPKKRVGHTATFIDNKLYILGGSLIDEVGKDFFYIDFSNPFNMQNLTFNDLSKNNTVPPHFSAGSAKGGANNDTLFICGGADYVDFTNLELVYTFNPKNNSWSIPKVTGEPAIIFVAETATIDQKSNMYFWDGIGPYLNILDTINLTWKKGNSAGASDGGLGSTATSLPDNKIIYLGKQVI